MSLNRMLSIRTRNIAVLFAAVTLIALSSCQSSEAPKASALKGFKGGETRQTLSPSSFTGDTARAYQAAPEIPEVLDSLYCYCDCEKHSGHKSLLSCYVDEHALNCDICINEALMAYELHKKGESMDAIRKAIDERFAHLSH
ncbi:MAG: hypothetical protein IT362_01230 [Deltaproteobacteria bacterium]|nr:hypothetical protein [Deltaproteobacteria bacterium]